jgi:hypothetical protein
VLKKGRQYQATSADDDEAYDLGAWEKKSSKIDSAKAAAREEKYAKQQANRLARKRRPDRYERDKEAGLVVAESEHAYVAADVYAMLDGQFILSSRAPCSMVTQMEDDTYAELRNWQKSIVRFNESKGKQTIFVETVEKVPSKEAAMMGSGPQTVVVAYPGDFDYGDAKIYFSKAFQESDAEWSQHKKVIPTPKGIRGKVPPGFPYIHVDFGLQYGLGHVIEETDSSPHMWRDFGRDVVLGMMEMDFLGERIHESKDAAAKSAGDLRSKFQAFSWLS